MRTVKADRYEPVTASALKACLLALLACAAVRALTPWLPAGPGWLDQYLFYGAAGGSTLLLALRVGHTRSDRFAWSCMAAGALAFSLGLVYYYAVASRRVPVPFPSLADLGWLLHYPFTYAALVALVRGRVLRVQASMWIDGLIAGLSVAALSAAFVLPVVLRNTGAPFDVVATNLAYPASDLLLLILLLAVLAVLSWRPGRMWWLLTAGLSAFMAADTAFLFAVAGDSYTPGGPIDLCWEAGLVLCALAAWQPSAPATRELAGPQTWVVLVVPTGLILVSLALLGYAGLRSVPAAAVLLALACVVVALVRTGLTFREVRGLAEARSQARTDELTGLANRRSFLEQTRAALACRPAHSQLAVLLLDLDRFKEVNDSLGHPTGDALLRLVALRLADVLREGDVVARLGGDEFGVLLAAADERHAVIVAERLLEGLRQPFDLDGLSVTSGASIGLALCPQDGDDTDVLLQRADIAMYQAKACRSGFQAYRVDTDSRSRQRLQTEEQLRVALAQDQLVLHYQPKLHLATGRVSGAEALVRWEHPTRGLVYPDGFLAVAEQSGLMHLLTLTILEKAIRQAAAWHAAGLDLTVAVNLSASDLLDQKLPEQVQLILQTVGVPVRALELEITENVFMADPDRALTVLRRLRRLGLRISLDDYGTGYSSLAYLQTLPVQELKLDRTFVTHMHLDSRSAAIVTSTISLAHSLGMTTVAEGVEDEAVLLLLHAAGCDVAQGYHIARPQPAPQLTHWLIEHAARTSATSVASTT